MSCAPRPKVSKLASYDWSVFAPVNGRILNLLADGTSRSVREVCDAIKSKSFSHARTVLFAMVAKGELATTKERRGNHAVDCFRLADSRGLRPVPKTVPAKRR